MTFFFRVSRIFLFFLLFIQCLSLKEQEAFDEANGTSSNSSLNSSTIQDDTSGESQGHNTSSTNTTSTTDNNDGDDQNNGNEDNNDNDDNNNEDDDDSEDNDNEDDDDNDNDDSEDDNDNNSTASPTQPTNTVSATFWSGDPISFSKPNGADPSLVENQDRITDKVWITRGNDGKQFYNAFIESSASKNESPIGTLWSMGTIAEIENLNFVNLRSATNGKPKTAVGKPMVLYLTEEKIYLSITITAWAQGKLGGFSYERLTPQ